ncbi:MAG: GIY-YIG nuclease family protein [Phenylobacterium sp.]|uniref:GIY-YIG nuclease family protein n=1 Tax=Phenylobacterium sp. TaxID=1871053 RepID=UPI0027346A42|nr:GIY-YIG nuclease family protein [Phenylobacterium sp.]MDP3174801.1 GIY-YIG nuclease family protein [Phenylobacterium sp.]
MTEGFVYVLTNAAMPGYIKIGLTQRDEVTDRIRQLDNTSTPPALRVLLRRPRSRLRQT